MDMKNNKTSIPKLILLIISEIVLCLVSVWVIGAALGWIYVGLGKLSGDGDVYYTTNINDYGKYIGNYDNKSVKKYISEFFPDEIQDNFKNVQYSYKAIKGDSISCEAYLEFTIKDEKEFDLYISQTVDTDKARPFTNDHAFCEYVIHDDMDFTSIKAHIGIDYANIQKILYSDENNTVIFVFIMVYDGGYTRANSFDVYFSRFDIDYMNYYNK